MTLREEKPLQTPALVSHKVPRTQRGGGKQTCGCHRTLPALFRLPLLLSFASSVLGYRGDFAFLVTSYPMRPYLLKSSVKQLRGVSVNSRRSFSCAQSFPFLVPMTARGVNTKRLCLKATRALKKRKAWRSLVHVS